MALDALSSHTARSLNSALLAAVGAKITLTRHVAVERIAALTPGFAGAKVTHIARSVVIRYV